MEALFAGSTPEFKFKGKDVLGVEGLVPSLSGNLYLQTGFSKISFVALSKFQHAG